MRTPPRGRHADGPGRRRRCRLVQSLSTSADEDPPAATTTTPADGTYDFLPQHLLLPDGNAVLPNITLQQTDGFLPIIRPSSETQTGRRSGTKSHQAIGVQVQADGTAVCFINILLGPNRRDACGRQPSSFLLCRRTDDRLTATITYHADEDTVWRQTPTFKTIGLLAAAGERCFDCLLVSPPLASKPDNKDMSIYVLTTKIYLTTSGVVK
ncbi:uncharacterized protein K441DRAFT_677933 [Cenococcum geophilum 1.58]|uniref:uncharacterized protein n=1 Tax=Cenococcum geophilum 1.58 TaxID=794803 RepID=UPI00358FA756|nr:hypothetical protein K441DRAFT_677933 [Cenococcum geophilum 1.58]